MIRRALVVAVIGAIAATVASAAPNFSGSWKLNTGKSEFGPMPAPDKMDRVIKHADPALNIKTTQSGAQGEITSELNYTTDGKEVVNKMRNADVKGTAAWDGATLVIKYAREFQGGELKIVERWSMSEDGKALTVNAAVSAPQGEVEIKYAFDRAAGDAPVATAAAPAKAAGARPNLSGTWKLNVAKSDFGPIPAPEKQTSKIEHSDPSVVSTVTQVGAEGESTYTLKYTTDGAPFKNELRGGELSGTANWEGNVLVISGKLEIQGMEIKMKQRMTVAEDGKSITSVQQLSTPQGDFEIKSLMEKVEN